MKLRIDKIDEFKKLKPDLLDQVLFWGAIYFNITPIGDASSLLGTLKTFFDGVGLNTNKLIDITLGMAYTMVALKEGIPIPDAKSVSPHAKRSTINEADYNKGKIYIMGLHKKGVDTYLLKKKENSTIALRVLFSFLVYAANFKRWSVINQILNDMVKNLFFSKYSSESEYQLYNQNENNMKNYYELEMENEFEDEFEDYEDEFEDYEDEFEDYEDEYEDYEDEFEDDEVAELYAERLEEMEYESFESEQEVDDELDDELELMVSEYFNKRLHKKKKRKRRPAARRGKRPGARRPGGKPGRRKRKRKGLFGRVLKAGANLVKKHGKKILKGVAKGALTAVGGPVAGIVGGKVIDAVVGDELEFYVTEMTPDEVADVSRDALKYMADEVMEYEIDTHEEARRVAKKSVHKAIRKNRIKPAKRKAAGNRRVIKLKPGEQVVIVKP